MAKKKIIFVCTGNTCRSPMAEYIFAEFLRRKRKLSKFEVSSAGLYAEEGDPMTPNAAEALSRMGIKPKKKHTARQLTPEKAGKADMIVCMTASHKRELAVLGDKVYTVSEITGGPDVPDPYGGSLEVYERTAQYLAYAADDIYTLAAKN